jgi:GWxTD domain-containing protein
LRRVDRACGLLHDVAVASARIQLLLFAACLAPGIAFAPAAEPSRQQRLDALPGDDRVWLTELVAPIILPDEERVFLKLTEVREREGFKEDFWQRREAPGLPPPLGPGYRDRYRELRQLVDQKYDGWKNDAGRLVLRRGEPDSISTPRCDGEQVFRDLEVWTYAGMELNGHPAARHIFYRPASGAPRRIWIVHDGNAIVFQPNPCRTSFDRLSSDCRPSREDRCGRCEDRCVIYQAWAEILKRQGSPAGALTEQGELFNYPRISAEGLNRPKARWALPAASSPPTLRPPEPSRTAAVATPTSTPSLVRPPTSTPAPQAARSPAPVRTPAAALAPPSPTPPAARQPTLSPALEVTRAPAPVPTPTAVKPTPVPTRAASPAVPTRAPSPKPTAALAPTPAPTAAAAGLRKLSREEIQERTAQLEPEYREFLDLAQPLMTEEELSRFLQLSGHDKDAFIRDFWKRRS